MVYTLDKADQRCDVTYVDWSKKYSPIPKATCEMIQPKCSSGGGGSYDDSVELKCEDLKKLIHGEDKPKEDKPKEDTPTEDNPQENPKEEETPKENNTPGENNTPREETPSDNVGGNPPTEEKPTTDEVTPKETEPNTSPREEDTPAEPTPEPPVADTPREETPNEDGKEVNLLELMPRVEDKFSTVLFNDGTVVSVIDNSPDEKVAFENEIITTLKGKLPEGAVVEAVLGEPYYKEGSEKVDGKTNYTLNVRVTLKGKVYEQEYNVPNKAYAVPVDSI